MLLYSRFAVSAQQRHEGGNATSGNDLGMVVFVVLSPDMSHIRNGLDRREGRVPTGQLLDQSGDRPSPGLMRGRMRQRGQRRRSHVCMGDM